MQQLTKQSQQKILKGGEAMKNVVVYEVHNPAVLDLKTDILISGGVTLCYRERGTYGNVYYIGDGMLVITEIPACCRDVRHFIIRNRERTFLVESLDTPTLLSGEEFLSYLRDLNERVELWTDCGLWYVERFIFTNPNERRKFQDFMTKEIYSKHYNWYYYSDYVDKDTFLEIVDKIKGMTNCK